MLNGMSQPPQKGNLHRRKTGVYLQCNQENPKQET
jgi:hypothetical protein